MTGVGHGVDHTRRPLTYPYPLFLGLLLQATIAGGGVIPHIHKSLITGKQGKEGPIIKP